MAISGQSAINLDITDAYFVKQTEFTRMLSPLLKALGWPGNNRHLLEALPHFSDSLNITQFRNVMATLNYQSEAVELHLDEIDESLLPGVFLPDDKPGLMIEKKQGENYIAFDSNQKKYISIEPSELSGKFYIFRKFEESANTSSKKWFVENIARFKPVIYQIFFISFILNLFLLTTPLFIMSVFDKIFRTNSIPMLISFSIGIFIVILGSIVLSKMRTKIIAYIGARLEITVGDAILEKLLYLSPSYTENAQVGTQVARIKDFDNVREFFTSSYLTVLFDLPFSLLFMGLIWYLGGNIILVPLVMLSVFGLVYLFSRKWIENAVQKSAKSHSEKQNFQLSTIDHLRNVKIQGMEKTWAKRFKELSAKATYHEFKASMYTATMNTLSDLIMMLSGLLVITLGVIKAVDGDMTVGALIACMMLVWRALSPIKVFFSILPKLNQITNSIAQINNLMKLRTERKPYETIKPFSQKEGNILFQRVSFRYRNDLPPSLLGISFYANAGEIVAIAGKNGSGKSTLLKLIPSLYQPQAGSIFLDGSNTKQLDPIELRHATAYMPQQVSLFYGTIKQNLLLGNPIATDHQIHEACRMASVLDEILTLEKGFDTKISDHIDGNYSSSFKQKIVLARTYIQDASVFLFDEPTTSLSREEDQQFLDVLETMRGKKTILLVTHRPNHMRFADRILYLDQGHLVLDGPPSDVLQKIPFGTFK